MLHKLKGTLTKRAEKLEWIVTVQDEEALLYNLKYPDSVLPDHLEARKQYLAKPRWK